MKKRQTEKRLTGSNLVDNSLVRREEVRGVVDELPALAVARQHDLGVGALCACLVTELVTITFSPMVSARRCDLPWWSGLP